MRLRERVQAEQGIDISPLIDMVFILLIFFMVSTTFVKDLKIDLERPGAASAERASTKAIRVHIDRTQEVYVDGQPVRPWMVQSRVRELLSGSTSRTLLVIADKLVTAVKLVDVVDQCRLGGANEVGVATEAEAL